MDLVERSRRTPWIAARLVGGLAEIKSDDTLKRIPVVVLTTSRDEADVLKSCDLHASCFISKPIDLGEFIKAVRSIEDLWLTIVSLPGGKRA